MEGNNIRKGKGSKYQPLNTAPQALCSSNSHLFGNARQPEDKASLAFSVDR